MTLPCGMPLVIVQGYNNDEPTRERWVRCEKKYEIQGKWYNNNNNNNKLL